MDLLDEFVEILITSDGVLDLLEGFYGFFASAYTAFDDCSGV